MEEFFWFGGYTTQEEEEKEANKVELDNMQDIYPNTKYLVETMQKIEQEFLKPTKTIIIEHESPKDTMTNVTCFEEELEKVRKTKQEKEQASKCTNDILTKSNLVIMNIK